MTDAQNSSIRNIGFVATRVHGTDGVSLEIGKWTRVLEHLGYDCFFVCGKSDRRDERTFLIEEADFLHPSIQTLNHQLFGRHYRSRGLSSHIRELANLMKQQIYAAIEQFSLDLLIAQNSLTIPLNIPLGAALLEVLIETGLPCIAHHHDFAWERERFLINAANDYIDAVFPPAIADIDHVVISSLAGEEFGRRTGLPYRVIPNVMDFAHPPAEPDDYACDFRETLGIDQDDILILQPTRVVPRKGIEHTVELVRRLDDPRCKLVVTHNGNDEGQSYGLRIRQYAEMLGVEIVFAEDHIADQRGQTPQGAKQYAIWDAYPHADLVAYPSTFEGFGNAFLEAVYYRKPIFCNRYTIFRTDIEPCGFEAIVMEGFLTDEVVSQVRKVLTDHEYRQAMVEQNYRAARKYYSFERVEQELRSILDKPRPSGPVSDRQANPEGVPSGVGRRNE
ncbi:MAG: glycosyltransferase [Planctomycetales bacterium]|nr:glycosyltransferase [Planctomycetales bacterium]NIM09482.1 glycosyltransferase [Planctomycetales bacterium]NIN08970.1 glycosyltransferase [Planctomycetales bacterium]NIN78085.1 glycosyltransferase [Planctomycetales bacterium]NIO35263.1 glycosyltransferase [Planctomycetales bacterium]